MDFGADMMRDQANDALGIGRRNTVAGILEATGRGGRSRAGRRD
jgi:hypothetical protein